MASVIAKKKGNKLYYYVVESARVEGKPRIVNQAYLGTAEKVAELVRDRTAPVPIDATSRDFGLPAALWQAAQHTGVWDLLQSLWPPLRSAPSQAHYLLLAAIHRICQPGPKTEVADWYAASVLSSWWEFPAERFTSQAFGDAFERILPEAEQHLTAGQDPLEQAQSRLLGLWKEKQQVSRRLLAYDTTNFYTYIASTNSRNQLAQRGHNKQGRHDLRQVGLSYVLDGENGLSLCHHVYAGNTADAEELPAALARITRLLDQNQITRETVTWVLDKGAAALANTVELQESGLGWISALPWNQAPAELRSRPAQELTALGSAYPGVRAAREKMLVHGREYRCILQYSASFAGEQMQSITTSISKVMQYLRRLNRDLSKPGAHWKHDQIVRKIERWLSSPFVSELIRYQIEEQNGRLRLQFDFDSQALNRLLEQRLGRTTLVTNRLDWSAEQVVAGYAGQQTLERVFRGLKGGGWLSWDPMYHWTDRKIRIHAFYCLLGISLLQHIHKQAQTAWAELSLEELLEQLGGIKEFVLLYPPQGEKGPARTAYVLSQRTLVQKALIKALDLERWHRNRSTQVG